MKDLKIAVIFTGGTIGSKVSGEHISASRDTKFELIERYTEKYGEEVNFVTFEPYFILSEKLSSKKLDKLICAFKEAEGSDADGIVVTHGTDSLHFSAAALSLVSEHNKPTLMVSANYPLDDPKSNGLDNFAAAVKFISEKAAKGVFVSYKNPEGNHFFHRGDRITAFLEGDDRLYSLGHKPFGELLKGEIKIYGEESALTPLPYTGLSESSDILCITAMPGDGFKYDLTDVRAVIMRPYHSGTLNTESPALINFCQDAKNKEIPVFLVNAPCGITYESTESFSSLNIIPLCDHTFALAYMRLWLELSAGGPISYLF